MSLLVLALALLSGASTGSQEDRSWTVQGATVYTAAGAPVENGLVTVRDGKIAGVAKGGGGSGANHLSVFAITPGMIDMSARLVPGNTSVEQSREVTPEYDVAQALDVFDERWTGLARSGVTTVLSCPQDMNVIGGLGVVIKTQGPESVGARIVQREAVLRGAFGSQPSMRNRSPSGRPETHFVRRPTTRMGVEWEHRKAFYDAAASRNDPARAFAGSDRLVAAMDGKLPFVVQAWSTQDIRTAVFLKEELAREGFGTLNLVVDAAAESWKEPQLLVRSKTAVVLPPFPVQGRTGEGAFMAHDTAQVLQEQGILFALSAHGSTDRLTSLGRQAGFAMRGGLSFTDALAAVTSTPARLLGVEKRVGSIEAGKDADLVLWNGPPFESTSAVVGVIVDGRLVLDPRARNGSQN